MNGRRKVNAFLAILVVLSVYAGTAASGGFVDKDGSGDTGHVIWNIGGEDRFNIYNSYPAEDIGRDKELGRIGRVTVDLENEYATCPHGLGRWVEAQGRKSFVKEIVFRFRSERAGNFRLHVIWNALQKGNDQFAVEVNGEPVGNSRLVDGSRQQNWSQVTREKFSVDIKAGDNTLVLRLLSGDGLRFRNIVLCEQEQIDDLPRALSPFLEIQSWKAFETVIGEPAVGIDSPFIRMYAPKRHEPNDMRHLLFLQSARLGERGQPVPEEVRSTAYRGCRLGDGARLQRRVHFRGLQPAISGERVVSAKGAVPFSLRKASAKIGAAPNRWYAISARLPSAVPSAVSVNGA